MAVIAEAVRHLIAAGVSGDALVQAIEDMESAASPERNARQDRNRRYYEKKSSEKRLKASYSDALPSNGSDGFNRFPDLPLSSLTSFTPHKERTPKGVPKKAPISDMVSIWNEVLGGVCPTIAKMNDGRMQAMRLRYVEDFNSDLGEWRAYCDAIRGSPWLVGENSRGWRAGIDFALRPSTVAKVLEGTYQNGTPMLMDETDKAVEEARKKYAQPV